MSFISSFKKQAFKNSCGDKIHRFSMCAFLAAIDHVRTLSLTSRLRTHAGATTSAPAHGAAPRSTSRSPPTTRRCSSSPTRGRTSTARRRRHSGASSPRTPLRAYPVRRATPSPARGSAAACGHHMERRPATMRDEKATSRCRGVTGDTPMAPCSAWPRTPHPLPCRMLLLLTRL